MPSDKVFGPVRERTTQKLTFTLKDEDGVVIPGGSLTELTLKLFVRGSTAGTYINSRNGTTDLKANCDANGLFTNEFTPADNAIQDATLPEERHIAVFRWKYSAGSKEGMAVYEILVLNEANVP